MFYIQTPPVVAQDGILLGKKASREKSEKAENTGNGGALDIIARPSQDTGHLGSADERKNYRARNGDVRTIWNTPVLNRFYRSDTALACLAS